MKIEVDDMVANGIMLDILEAVVKAQMKEIIEDGSDYTHPDDEKYYKDLKAAARTIYNYYSVAGVEL